MNDESLMPAAPAIVTMIPYCPRARGRNLGLAYNQMMLRLNEDEWACFIDHDACFTTRDWYAQLEQIVVRLDEPCVLTCKTNRVGSAWQLAEGVAWDDHSMTYHRRVGAELARQFNLQVTDVTDRSPMSGVVILLSKRTWKALGGFADGFLGVDSQLHARARELSIPVYLMEGVYVYHWYRADAYDGHQPPEGNGYTVDKILVTAPSAGHGNHQAASAQSSDVCNATFLQELYELVPTVVKSIMVVGRHGPMLVGRLTGEGRSIDYINSLADLATLGVRPAMVADSVVPESLTEQFDCIVCLHPLGEVDDPHVALKRLHGKLKEGGVFIGWVANLRNQRAITTLLHGGWHARPGEPSTRYYTRRELEKVLFRSGFAIDVIRGKRDDHPQAPCRGNSPRGNLAALSEQCLSQFEREEFSIANYVFRATASPPLQCGMTSIVLVAHNQIAYTHQCIESIRNYTDEPYELIVVDNGSTDGTVDYLQFAPDVRLIENATNRGFPAGANQGIRAAIGEQVLLLNNDTLVTTGWLRRLCQVFSDRPEVGIVGPCSNEVSGPQQVAISYNDLADLDGFAWEFGKRRDRQTLDVTRLVGFCMLIRRRVLDDIGLLDERFGVGMWEDDDYSLRAVRAGWALAIALDAFVHHYGNRTFMGSGADFNRILHENKVQFDEKWSHTSSIPELTTTSPPEDRTEFVIRKGHGLYLEPTKPLLSLCMIVRDNENTLPASLASIRPWVDEIVVVDTGSTDSTPAIAKSFGARVHHFPWCDDFSAARNESLKHARGEWLFWMDSDDTISSENGQKLYELVRGDHADSILGYVVQVHCPAGTDDAALDVTVVDHVKLVRNRPELRFEGRIHEQILPAIRAVDGDVLWTDIFVVHSGSDQSPAGRHAKCDRDLRILQRDLEDRPGHPFVLFNLGMTYFELERYGQAIDALKQSIDTSSSNESQLRKAYALLTGSLCALDRWDEGMRACDEGLEKFPDDTELHFRRGTILHRNGQPQEAIAAYSLALANSEDRHFESVDRGLRGFKAYHNLALVYQEVGDLVRAEDSWRKSIEKTPTYRQGWRGLGDCLLQRNARTQAESVVLELFREPKLSGEGHLLLAKLSAAEGRFESALVNADRAAQEIPGDPEPLRFKCQMLFKQQNPKLLEESLKQLLACDATDPSTHHNLGVLYARQGLPAAAECFRQALQLRPGYKPSLAALKELVQPPELSQTNHAECSEAPRD